MPPFSIRPATPADATAIAQVHVQSWREAYTGIIPDHVLARMSVDRRAMIWRENMTTFADTNFIDVAESPSASIVGFASGGPERDNVEGYAGKDGGGEIYALYVLRSHHRQGIGRALVQSVAQRLHEAGFRSLLLWVLALNPARNFYEHLGGEPVVEKEIEIGGATLREIAYGWPDIRALTNVKNGERR